MYAGNACIGIPLPLSRYVDKEATVRFAWPHPTFYVDPKKSQSLKQMVHYAEISLKIV